MKKILFSLLAAVMLLSLASCGTPEATPYSTKVNFTDSNGKTCFYEYEYLGTELTAFRIIDANSVPIVEYKTTDDMTVSATQATRGTVTVRLTYADDDATVETLSYVNGKFEHAYKYINNSKGEQIMISFKRYDKNGELIIDRNIGQTGVDRFLTYTYTKDRCIVNECLPGNKTLFIHRYKAADGSVIEDFRHFFDENGTKLGWIMYDGDGELLEREVMTYVPAYNDGTAREVELKDANGNTYGTAKYDAKGNLVEDNKD